MDKLNLQKFNFFEKNINLLQPKIKTMDEKTAGIVSYLWWVGLIIVILTNKTRSEYVSFHMRQSLGILLLWAVSGIVYYALGFAIFGIISLLIFILWIFGFIGALNNERKLIPIVGEYFQRWFKSI